MYSPKVWILSDDLLAHRQGWGPRNNWMTNVRIKQECIGRSRMCIVLRSSCPKNVAFGNCIQVDAIGKWYFFWSRPRICGRKCCIMRHRWSYDVMVGATSPGGKTRWGKSHKKKKTVPIIFPWYHRQPFFIWYCLCFRSFLLQLSTPVTSLFFFFLDFATEAVSCQVTPSIFLQCLSV